MAQHTEFVTPSSKNAQLTERLGSSSCVRDRTQPKKWQKLTQLRYVHCYALSLLRTLPLVRAHKLPKVSIWVCQIAGISP
jgi:hypothetical protein